jgi:hypothetical protein
VGAERGYSRCHLDWQVGTKNDGPEEVEQIFATMIKYGEMKV